MQIGDHVFVSKPVFGQYGRFYTHHGIYIGGQQVIHYGGYANGFSSSDTDKQVALVSLDSFRGAQTVQVRQHVRRFSRQAVVQRARSRLGENDYNLLWRNCEHFATWCWTDEERSDQVRKAAKVIGGVTAAGITIKAATSSAGHQAVVQGVQRLTGSPLALAGAAVVGIGYGLYRLWDEYA